MHNTVTASIAACQADLETFLREIVAIPSPGGAEGPVIERIQREMHTLEYDEVRIDGMGNCIGRIGSGPRVLALDGHCDTVGSGDRAAWAKDPHSGVLEGGRIHGRGSVDQKGGFAAAIYAGSVLKEIGLPDDVTLCVVASVQEENFEGLNWQHLIETESLRPAVVILTEPSNMQIKTGHRGRMEMKLRVEGRSSHGSRPERGENAIYTIMPVVREIEELNRSLAGPDPLGKGSIAVTDIHSSAPSLCAIPDSAEIHLDRRLTKGETAKSCLREIESLSALKGRSYQLWVPEYRVKNYTGLTLDQKAYYPMWLLEDEDPLVKSAVTAYSQVFQADTPPGVWQFATNGVATKGLYGIPTIGFGPGDEAMAHAPDESIPVSEVLDAAAFYSALILDWGTFGRE